MPERMPQGVQLRDLDDIDSTRDAIYNSTLQSFRQLQPVSNTRYQLDLSDIDYAGRDRYSRAEENRAILEGRSLHRRLAGTWNLRDPQGQVLESKRMTLANVPYLSSLGTFINNGSEYNLANQLRLRPGIYARQQANGDLESHVNVSKGFGHKYYLDPATGVFRIQLHQSKMPLVPLLKTLGATDDQIRQAWGNELWAANAGKQDPTVIKKIYQKLYPNKAAADEGSMAEGVRKAFNDIELDPDVTQQTLGKPYSKLDINAMLDATKKLLSVHRGEADTDDRDAMQYQKLMTAEDLFADRVTQAKKLLHSGLWKASNTGNLKRISPAYFDKMLRGTILDTGLGQVLEQINPAEILDRRMAVTRMGEGGIGSSDSVPDDARMVAPSQFGYVDPVQTPESGRIGIDGRLTYQTKKGSDGRLYSKFLDHRTGEHAWLSPQEVAQKVVAFPGEFPQGKTYGRVLDKGRMRFADRGEVDYELSQAADSFGPMANMLPMKAGIFPQRASMGSRMTTQALSLADAEAPYVRNKLPGQESSFEKLYGKTLGAIPSDTDGTVLAVSPTEITVRGVDGQTRKHELYNNRIFNRKSYLHNTPTVEPGQQIKAGQILAKSNYTDADGVAAVGKNARVAFIPNGHNYEDATVVSEGFAKRMTSEHAYQFDVDKEDNTEISKNKFVSIFPGKYSRKQLENFDDDGVIKPGTVVNYNEPLILAVKQATVGPRLGRRKSSFREADTIWDHHQPGVVTDVVKSKGGVNVVVKGQQALQVGDKLSGRYGNKGVVAQILPDAQMPQGKDGKPFEILYNPLGTISRGNPGAILEAALGKIAEKTGKPYDMEDFGSINSIEDLADFVSTEMRKNGVDDLEDLLDPGSGRTMKQVNTGNTYVMKLHHTAEAKAQGRSIGGYSAEGLPAKGGASGAKRVGMLDLWALLSHGAYNVIRDAGVVRGQRNEEMWRQYMSGFTPPSPAVPHVYTKFMNELRAMGINPVRQGTRTQLLAMRDADVDTLAEGRELKSGDTVDWNTDRLTPKRGGLFDETLTGGHGGKRWTYIKLHEPLPNPIFEDPIKKVLGLTQKEYESILAGTGTPNPLPKGGLAAFQPGNTGPAALQQTLKNIDLDKEINRAQMEIKGTRKTARDAAIKRFGFLKDSKRIGIHPSDWIMTKVPVLPPLFRPVSMMQTSKTPLVDDPNYLYRDLIEANDTLKNLSDKVDDVGEERMALYGSFKALTGLGDPIKPQTQEQKVKGILRHIIGNSPKHGMVQRKLLGSTVDLVGRATIIPNPALDMDQIGIPIEEAWTMYKPFVVRRLVRQGMKHLQALDEADKRTKTAEKAMLSEMDARPIMANRAPVLHRYGIMAFKPVPVKGKTLQMPLLVYSGFGADNDGDAMQFHVIQDETAAKEAMDKMLPSRNLFSPSNFKVHQLPVQEYVAGLHAATSGEDNTPVRTFRSKADAMAAYKRGELNLSHRVQILEH